MHRFIVSLSLCALVAACGDDEPASDDDDDTSSGSADDGSSTSSGGSSSSESTTDIDPTVEPESSTGEPAECVVSTQLTWVRDTIVVSADPCMDWIDDTHGRVGQLGTASASVWTRRTFNGTAIALSAAHLLEDGAFGVPGTDIPAQLVDPNTSTPALGAVYPDTSGTGNLNETYSASFQLFNPEIPAAESDDMLANLLPRHDFYLTVVDGQNLPIEEEPDPPPMPEPLSNSPLQLYDPGDYSVESPTSAAVDAGELVAVLGVPTEGEYEGRLVYSIGRVLDDTEAEAAIADLAGAGDPAGDLAYDPEAEFLIETVFAAGMLGGGVFDQGRVHVGLTVRASAAAEDPKIVRAVRTPFVVDQLNATYDALDPKLQEAIGIYLEAE